MDKREKNTTRKYTDHPSIATDICFYCGNYGDQADHYPALAIERYLEGIEGLRIRACVSCNEILGVSHQSSLELRRAFIQEHLRAIKSSMHLPSDSRTRVAWKNEEERREWLKWHHVVLALAKGPSYRDADSMLEELTTEDPRDKVLAIIENAIQEKGAVEYNLLYAIVYREARAELASFEAALIEAIKAGKLLIVKTPAGKCYIAAKEKSLERNVITP